MVEEWRSVQDYEGLYEVSSTGLVKSLERSCYDSVRNHYRSIKERILKSVPDKNGYLQVALSKNGKLTTKKVHRLVATAFIKNIYNLKEVNHIDKDVTNNNVSNLEWCSRAGNVTHQYKCYFIVENPEGDLIEGWNITHFAKLNNLHPRLFNYLLNGKQKTHRGWKKVKYFTYKQYQLCVE